MTDAWMAQIPAAIAHWASTDPVLAELAADYVPDKVFERHEGFTALAQAIVHQQISMAAGRSIWARFVEATGGTPEGVVAAGEDALRGAGLSRSKTSYLLDLAQHVLDGRLDLGALPAMSDASAIAALTAVKGIGVWSAKMFLIFEMQRPDICPWEDLGVRLSVERFYGIPEPEVAPWMKEEARHMWSPYNSLAAIVLWHAREA